MNKKNLKKNGGITLIALVVTIIVLLILAGVSISMLTGENGLLKQAADAKTETRGGTVQEKVNLWKSENKLKEYTDETYVSEEDMLKDLIDNKYVYEEEIDREAKTITIGKRTISYSNDNINWENIYVYKELTEEERAEYSSLTELKEGEKYGVITGLKDEYYYEMIASKNKKIASIDGLEIAVAIANCYLSEGLNGTLKIPNKIENMNIIGIGVDAFAVFKNLQKVEISEGIVLIEEWAFSCCENLSYVRLPKSLKGIEEFAFADCDALETGTVIYNGLYKEFENIKIGYWGNDAIVVHFSDEQSAYIEYAKNILSKLPSNKEERRIELEKIFMEGGKYEVLGSLNSITNVEIPEDATEEEIELFKYIKESYERLLDIEDFEEFLKLYLLITVPDYTGEYTLEGIRNYANQKFGYFDNVEDMLIKIEYVKPAGFFGELTKPE